VQQTLTQDINEVYFAYKNIRLVFWLAYPHCTDSAPQQLSRTGCFKEYDMKAIFDLFRRMAESDERRERERRDAYLAESSDIYDLEYRMRQLDRETRPSAPWMGVTGS
jgi:hypothetical protein